MNIRSVPRAETIVDTKEPMIVPLLVMFLATPDVRLLRRVRCGIDDPEHGVQFGNFSIGNGFENLQQHSVVLLQSYRFVDIVVDILELCTGPVQLLPRGRRHDLHGKGFVTDGGTAKTRVWVAGSKQPIVELRSEMGIEKGLALPQQIARDGQVGHPTKELAYVLFVVHIRDGKQRIGEILRAIQVKTKELRLRSAIRIDKGVPLEDLGAEMVVPRLHGPHVARLGRKSDTTMVLVHAIQDGHPRKLTRRSQVEGPSEPLDKALFFSCNGSPTASAPRGSAAGRAAL